MGCPRDIGYAGVADPSKKDYTHFGGLSGNDCRQDRQRHRLLFFVVLLLHLRVDQQEPVIPPETLAHFAMFPVEDNAVPRSLGFR